jgi:tRNA-splicing ligase RtcB (3'-phosphate/5'-hydroxy nucleic acid ligase)
MIEVKGKFCTAKVFSDNVAEEAVEQIRLLCNQSFVKGCTIRIMPDVHVGKSCVIGFTADLGDKVIPNIVGVDIGCGMLTVELGKIKIDYENLDNIIRENIPSEMNAHKKAVLKFPKLKDLIVYKELKERSWIEKSMGSLGGGNHFIEVNKDDEDNIYLVIHSGSRSLGKQIAEIYQRLAIDICSGKGDYIEKRDSLIKEYKENGREKEIQGALFELKNRYEEMKPTCPEELCYLTDNHRDNYLHDMDICQQYANFNRETMANIILNKLLNKNLEDFTYFQTIHNYINFNDNIIRKGSISANKGERILIPMNMRDRSLLCIGKGNKDWNNSAPHGAGRIMSRIQAKKNFTLDEFKDSMKGIWTTSICNETIDECPMAYKPMDEIVRSIGETADIIKILKPVYNFKAN